MTITKQRYTPSGLHSVEASGFACGPTNTRTPSIKLDEHKELAAYNSLCEGLTTHVRDHRFMCDSRLISVSIDTDTHTHIHRHARLLRMSWPLVRPLVPKYHAQTTLAECSAKGACAVGYVKAADLSPVSDFAMIYSKLIGLSSYCSKRDTE